MRWTIYTFIPNYCNSTTRSHSRSPTGRGMSNYKSISSRSLSCLTICTNPTRNSSTKWACRSVCLIQNINIKMSLLLLLFLNSESSINLSPISFCFLIYCLAVKMESSLDLVKVDMILKCLLFSVILLHFIRDYLLLLLLDFVSINIFGIN